MRKYAKLIDKKYKGAKFYVYEDIGDGNYRYVGSRSTRGWVYSSTNIIIKPCYLTSSVFKWKYMSQEETDNLLIDLL